jgi:undecaprenyl-diphosphatase
LIFIAIFTALFLLLWLVFYLSGPTFERLLSRGAKYTAGFRYRDYLGVVLLLAIGVGATAAIGDGFMDITERLQADSPKLHELDAMTHAWAFETRTGGATTFFTTWTLVGTPLGLGILTAVVSAVLVWRKKPKWAIYLLFTSAVGGLLNQALKLLFARARPELAEALRGAHGYSFPSGHAMGSTVVFGALAYLAFRTIHPWGWRAAALSLAACAITAISVSRIYLGVHWISDIAAGITAGTVWVIVTTLAYETFRRIRRVRALRTAAQLEATSSSRTSLGE